MTARSAVVAALACVALASSGCVTVVEHPKQRGVVMKSDGKRVAPSLPPGTNTANPADPQSALTTPVPPMQLPEGGTIAQPVTSGTMATRVQVTVVPLGIVAYDGQTLPIVSPDGRFVAVQSGGAPTWATILATEGQTPADRTKLDIYEVTDRGLKPVATTAVIPKGATLGRDATTNGFLIESVQAGGARWIGEVGWATGEARWLVQGNAVNSHAAWLRGASADSLVFTRREIGEQLRGALMVQHQGVEQLVSEGAWWFATPAPSGNVVYACDITKGLTIAAFGVNHDSGRVRVSGPVANRSLSADADPAMAYEIFASMQPGAWMARPLSSEANVTDAIAMIDASAGREALYDSKAGTLRGLGKGTVASVRWDEVDQAGVRATGYFLTSRQGLVFLPDSAVGSNLEPARVLGSPYVPRAVRDSRGASLLCFGPGKGGYTRLEVLRVVVGGAEPEKK
ncbi:MAG: hypothetical protein U0640_11380 [Phycisphaerales bacterium]